MALSEQVSNRNGTQTTTLVSQKRRWVAPQVLGGFLSVLRNGRGWTKADIVTNAFVFITIGNWGLNLVDTTPDHPRV